MEEYEEGRTCGETGRDFRKKSGIPPWSERKTKPATESLLKKVFTRGLELDFDEYDMERIAQHLFGKEIKELNIGEAHTIIRYINAMPRNPLGNSGESESEEE